MWVNFTPLLYCTFTQTSMRKSKFNCDRVLVFIFTELIYIYIYTHTHTHIMCAFYTKTDDPPLPPPAHFQQFQSLYDFRLVPLLARFLLPAASFYRSHTLLYFSWHAVVSQPSCFRVAVPSSLHLGNRLNKTLKHWILLILKFKPGFNVQRTSPFTGNSRLYAMCFQIPTQVLSQKHFVTQNNIIIHTYFISSPSFIFIIFISQVSYIRWSSRLCRMKN